MRIANVEGRLALSTTAGYVDIASASKGRFSYDPQGAFEVWEELIDWSQGVLDDAAPEGRYVTPAEDAILGPPVPRPRQVFAIGLNYPDHTEEAGFTKPASPPVFTKFPTSLTGPTASVHLPAGSVDWEVELVVAIGKLCERVVEEKAWDYVAGVTVGQDLSERELQLSGPAPQFSLGKSYPRFAPIGPALVTPDELTEPDDLKLGCGLEGGDVLQRGRTSDMIFSVPELIARLSAVCPLLPGDLLFTGTPSGVGIARKPPIFLAAGDVLVSWVTGIGRLRNPMIDGSHA